jgi:hypothetical protein
MIRSINNKNLTFSDVSLSGTQTPGSTRIIGSIFLPANSLSIGDSFIVSFFANYLSTDGGSFQYYLYWNTSNTTLTNAVQLGYYQTPPITSFFGLAFYRHFVVTSNGFRFYQYNSTTSLLHDYGNYSGRVSLSDTLSLNLDSYLICAVTLSSGSELITTNLRRFTLEL